METENIKLIGHYNGIPIYKDKDKSDPNYGWRCRGPLKEDANLNTGFAVLNHSTGMITQPNGEPISYQKVRYETKFFLVGTDDLDKAIESISKLTDNNFETKGSV